MNTQSGYILVVDDIPELLGFTVGEVPLAIARFVVPEGIGAGANGVLEHIEGGAELPPEGGFPSRFHFSPEVG